jgi:hypothetical protein
MYRDNQQEIPTDVELAWLAGVLECDGSVMLSCFVRKERAKPKMGVELKVYNTDGGIISKVVDILERLGLSYHITERTQKPMDMKNNKSYGDLTRPMISVAVKNLGAAYALGKILHPMMSGEKKHRLSLMLQFLARRLSKMEDAEGNRRRVPYDKGDCQIVADFYKRFVKRPGHNRHLVEAILNDFT